MVPSKQKKKTPTNGCDSYCISYCGGTCKCTRPLGAPSEHRIILLKSGTSLRPFVDACFQLDSSWNLWKKSPCLSLDSNPFVASKLKCGTSTSTQKSPTLGIHLPSNLPSSTWPSPSREDPLAFEVVWFFLYLWCHCVCFSHWKTATPSKMKLRQMFLLGGNLWQDTFVGSACRPESGEVFWWSSFMRHLGHVSRQQSAAEIIAKAGSGQRQAPMQIWQQNLKSCISLPTKNKHGTWKFTHKRKRRKIYQKQQLFSSMTVFGYIYCVSKSVVSTVDTFYWKNADTLKANTQAIHGPAGRLQYEHVYAYISKYIYIYIYIHMSISTASDHQTWTKISGLVHF